MSLTYGSLFSALGGLDLEVDRAGMDCKWQEGVPHGWTDGQSDATVV